MPESILEFSVRLIKNGEAKFESSIRQPLFATEERKRATVSAWLQLMENGLKLSQLLKDETDD